MPRSGAVPPTRGRFRHRCAAHPAIAYDFAQLQVEPQLQVSPQRQPARRSDWAAWQPQVQVLPTQVPQVQVFVALFMFGSS